MAIGIMLCATYILEKITKLLLILKGQYGLTIIYKQANTKIY